MSFLSPAQHPEMTENKPDSLEAWRATVFNRIIRMIGFAGTAAYLLNMAVSYKEITFGFFISYTLAYLWILAAAFLPRIPIVYRIYSFTIIIFGLGVASSIEKGTIGDGRVWLMLSIVLTAIFLGRRAGAVFTVTATLAWALIGYFINTAAIVPQEIAPYSFSIWSGTTITFFLSNMIVILTISLLLVNLDKTIKNSYALANKSEEQKNELETQRNALERRSNTLETSAKISRHLASLTAHQDILEQASKLLREEFELNSTAIFLLAPPNVLRLASSDGWNKQAHPTHEYSLSLEEDIVGVSVVTGKAHTSSESELGLKVILENTRSYAVIPLHGRSDIVLGALLMQSEASDTFGAERITIFQVFVDQLALLLENAELLAQKENALEIERRAYGEISQAAWGDFVSAQSYSAYRRDENGLVGMQAKPFHPEEKDAGSEQVPISVRGKVIGYVDAHKPKNRAWTASEKELLRILTARLETAMDGARLYQEAQERAMEDRIISETSARMRESLDIEGVLKIAANELRKNLGIAEAEVWISADHLQSLDAGLPSSEQEQ